MKKYDKIVKLDTDYKPIQDIEVMNAIPPGVYTVNVNQEGDIFFSAIKTRHDNLVDLPNTEYDTVIKEIETFMKPETRAVFEEYGFLYKRSSLLYGPPGTGKTCIVNRVVQKVVADKGIVLFSPNPKLLEEAFRILDSIQPDSRVMVIFEELDELIKNYESSLLNILDGEIQKNNVIFMATTNYIDLIPARIRRPGRFSSVIPVGFPSEATRHFYLTHKLKTFSSSEISDWAKRTVDFSIDELKETVLSVVCLGYKLDDILKRISLNKRDVEYNVEEELDDDEDQFQDEIDNLRRGNALDTTKNRFDRRR